MANFVWLALITCSLSVYCEVYINEVAPSGGGAACGHSDWVELHNDGNTDINISGYLLCDRNGCSYTKAYTFPSNSTIASKGYLVVCKKNGTHQPGFEFGIGTSDTVLLANASGNNTLSTTGKMKGRSDGYTYARLPSGSFNYVATATPGAANDQTLAPFSCTDEEACWDLFDANKLRSYNLEITPSNLQKMMEDIRKEVYVPCKVTVNYGTQEAEEYPDAGCRTKGSHGAFHMCDGRPFLDKAVIDACRKLSLKVDANYFNAGSSVRFHGLKKLQFHGMIADASLMFERLAYNFMQRAKIFSSRAVHAKMYVNSVSNGVHLLVEQIDDRFLDARLKGKVVDSSTLYKELWMTGCTSSRPTRTCPDEGEWTDSTCAKCMSCNGGACQWQGCSKGICYGGEEYPACAGQPKFAPLEEGGVCDYLEGKAIRWSPCQDMNKPVESCYHRHRRDGTGEHANLFDSIKNEAQQCKNNDCSASEALQFVDKYFNKSALVDALVATLLDMDQFTTIYGLQGNGGHNFYTVVNDNFAGQVEKVTMVPWDFDRGFALCKVSSCPGGGYLGDLTHNGKAPILEGHLAMQRGTPWGRCFMPPWFADVTKDSTLNKKYCEDGITTFQQHRHSSCLPLTNVFARALKSDYATRMLEVLNGADTWAEQQLTAWRAQIATAVEEDANNGGYPTLSQWQLTQASTLQRAKDVFAWGRLLAAAAESAARDQAVAPTEDAASCFTQGAEMVTSRAQSSAAFVIAMVASGVHAMVGLLSYEMA